MFKWFGIIAVAAVLIVTSMQLVPVYIQNHAVKKIAHEVVSDSELANRPKREVTKRVTELFASNDIDLDAKEAVVVSRDNAGEWVMGVKYEERRKLLYNLHIVAAFDDQITN